MDDNATGTRPDWFTERRTAATRIHPLGRDEALPLSYSQQQLWRFGRSGSSPSHHVTASLRLRGKLDRQALRRALDRIVARHKVLRTTFSGIEDLSRWVSVPLDAGFALVEQEVESQGVVEQISRQEARDPFDLSVGPLIRGRLLQLSEDEHVMLITQHRLVSDSSSVSVLLRELSTLYSAFALGRSNPLPPLELQYADYASWQRQNITMDVLNEQLEFWTRTLTGSPTPTQLPTDRPRPGLQHGASDRVRLKLSTALAKRLVQLARQQRVSLFVTLLSGWAVLLGRWCGQVEVFIGTRVANRQPPETASLIGPFENTLVLKICMQQDPTVEQLLKHVKAVVADAHAHQDVPFEKVVDSLDPTRGRDPRPQLHVAMNDIAASNSFEVQLASLKVTEVSVRSTDAQFELSLSMSDGKEGLVATLEYASDLFERKTVERMAACWQMLLKGMIKHARRPISRIGMLPAAERKRVLYELNEMAAACPEDPLIHELFEEQVQRTPDATAVEHEGQRLTYVELNSRANKLARYLKDRSVGPDQLVALCVERSLEMVIGMLGVLKAGGAYVPLDPQYPAERLAYMLKDAMPRILLTQKHLRNTLPPATMEVIEIDGEWTTISTYDDTNLARGALGLTALHLAYVIYTSGSTGVPKGAMNEHRGMVNRIIAQKDIEGFSEGDICCQKTSISFVDAVFEIFGALCTGRPLMIIPAAVIRDSEQMAALIARQHITRLTTVPSLARSMSESPDIMRNLSGLRSWTLSGEEVHADLLMKLQRTLPMCEFIIQYGSSEVSSDAAIFRSKSFEGERVPLGRPLRNVQVYVLDRHGEPVPTGVVGEIHVAGVGVGRGYLNRPDLTSARFLHDRFSARSDARLYKTGDLGRWRADGMLEYRGRNDHQVKVRGFRIELGEIEAQLLREPQVREAVVVAREDVPGEKRLVAYVTLRDQSGAEGTESSVICTSSQISAEDRVNSHGTPPPSAGAELRALLRASLPEYMVPAAFMVLEAMPLTPNGKLDRRALPAPAVDAYTTRPFEAPQGQIEQTLADVWQELLRVERIGRHDNFFELGGHSLLIVQMIERLRSAGLSAPVAAIFGSPTLADLARTLAVITDGEADQAEIHPNLIPPLCSVITPEMLPQVELESKQIEHIAQTVPGGAANVQDIYPLAPLQEGLLFHHLLDEQSGDTYVEATLLALNSRERLEELIAALQRVIDRHDVLRTALLWKQLPLPLQVVYRRATLPVQEVALDRDLGVTEQLAEWMLPEQQRLNLQQAPLLRLQIAADPIGTQWYARLQVHHIVSDDASLKALISEIVSHLEGSVDELPKPFGYRNHVAQALTRARSQDAESFFRTKLGDLDEPTALFGLLEVHTEPGLIDEARQELEAALAKRVRLQARRLGVSTATLFHAAWSLVVARTSGRDDVVFGTVLLGRLQSDASVQRAIGMFVNTLPLRLRLKEVTARQLVERTQRELIELLTYEQASLAIAQRCSGIIESVPLFNAVLNYRHGAVTPTAEWASAAGIQVLEHRERTNYPITLSVDDDEQGFMLAAQTERRIDPHRIITYLQTALQSLVAALERTPQTPALALLVMPETERHQLVNLFNSTKALYPQDTLVHELFESQALRTPDATAVEHEGDRLTYAQLNSAANQLARYLRDEGVSANGLVGVCLERSTEMVVGLLGILKAGGAYLPLDPAYPFERLAHMLEDAAPQVLLTQRRLRGTLSGVPTRLIVLDALLEQIPGQSDRNLPASDRGLTPEHLVYVIYTSGSTGRPKGTAMTHRSMVNLIEWHRGNLDASDGQRVLQFAALSFDVAFQEIFSTLCTGGTLVLLDEWVRRDARALMQYLSDRFINRLFVPPLMLQSLAVCAETASAVPQMLRDVITAGEQLHITREIIELFKRLPECRLHNHYGPTETHVVTALTMTGDRDQWPALPTIGRPISNSRIYVLDGQRHLVPIGSAGEIYIGGAGVARGYLGRPELTSERFIPDPFSPEQQARLYKTGDVGRWRADGTIEYLGRNDQQVKIRGFRIELGEIEAQLARHGKVKDAVVVPREDVSGDKRLIAYVIGGETVPTAAELRDYLRAVLAEYMVPSAFVMLERLPLTPNGKLDRRALPAPEQDAYVSQQYEAPCGEIEQDLAEIWRTLLHVERVGRRDNFFQLGGHSLLAMQVVARIGVSFSIEVPMRLLFECPTLEQLSVRVDDLRQARLLEEIRDGEDDMKDLLERVAAMSESEVKKLMLEVRQDGHG